MPGVSVTIKEENRNITFARLRICKVHEVGEYSSRRLALPAMQGNESVALSGITIGGIINACEVPEGHLVLVGSSSSSSCSSSGIRDVVYTLRQDE